MGGKETRISEKWKRNIFAGGLERVEEIEGAAENLPFGAGNF
jgi:hypothetical protein